MNDEGCELFRCLCRTHGYYDDYGYPRYVSVAEKRARARRKLEQLRKKHPDIRPVAIAGNALVHTWWGKAWNGNLGKYADYANRIGRGRSYVRHGAVLDLQIKPGQITPWCRALSPIRSRSDQARQRAGLAEIKAACAGQHSLQELWSFPKGLAELFTAKGSGLFPAPQEIDFHCSCPDWAYMCKHVAAVLYGIGTRLDEDPSLFFVLRKMKMDDLITQAVQDKSERLLKQAKKKTARVIDDADLGEVFGIEMEPVAAPEKEETAAQTPRKSSLRRTPKKRAK
jgi:uncharacterized Zn finger protein